MNPRNKLNEDDIELIYWAIDESKKHRSNGQLSAAVDSIKDKISVALELQKEGRDTMSALARLVVAISSYKELLTSNGYDVKSDPIIEILSMNGLTDKAPANAPGLKQDNSRRALPFGPSSKPSSSGIPVRSKSDPKDQKPKTKRRTSFFNSQSTSPTFKQEQKPINDVERLESEIKALSGAMNDHLATMTKEGRSKKPDDIMIFQTMGKKLRETERQLEELKRAQDQSVKKLK